MDVKINGLINNVNSQNQTIHKNKVTSTKADAKKTNSEQNGVIYEPSEKNSKVADPDLISKLKADVEQRTSQFKQLVENMLLEQGKAFTKNEDIWKLLAEGDFTVDKATADAAADEISENGYWGVEQTSARILSFAEALTGGDPDQMEKMQDAFTKGFKNASKAWGNKLPDISQRTYDAVMNKFDNYGKENLVNE
jgi:hypothetical protein